MGFKFLNFNEYIFFFFWGGGLKNEYFGEFGDFVDIFGSTRMVLGSFL